MEKKNFKININKENMKKPDGPLILKAVLILFLIGFLALVYVRSSAKDVSMSAFTKAYKSETKITKVMKSQSSRQLMQFMGLDATDYKGFTYYKSPDAMNTTELLIIKAYKKSDLNDVEDQVEEHVRSQVKIFEGYAPKQVAMLNNAIITKRGNYLFYCVATDPEKYEEVFIHVI